MENHPANIFLAAVISLVVCSGLMMGVFFLDFVLCDRQCLVPEVDIEEAQRTIIYLTDDQDLERMQEMMEQQSIYDFLSTLLITLTYWEVWIAFGLVAIIIINLPKTQADLEQIEDEINCLIKKMSRSRKDQPNHLAPTISVGYIIDVKRREPCQEIL